MFWVKLHQGVDVAVRSEVVTKNGAEELQPPDVMSTEFRQNVTID